MGRGGTGASSDLGVERRAEDPTAMSVIKASPMRSKVPIQPSLLEESGTSGGTIACSHS